MPAPGLIGELADPFAPELLVPGDVAGRTSGADSAPVCTMPDVLAAGAAESAVSLPFFSDRSC